MKSLIQTMFSPGNLLSNIFINNNLFPHSNNKKFWVTTGLYPQELLIDLGSAKPVNQINFTTTGGIP